MGTEIMVAVTGRDVGGPIRRLASRTHELGGRWLGSRFVHSGGLFAGVIKIDIPAGAADKLEAGLRELGEMTLLLSEPADPRPATRRRMVLTFEAVDRSGLLSDVTRLLLDYDIGVEKTDCHRFDVVDAGEMVIKASLALLAPVGLDEAELREALEDLEKSIRLTLEPAPTR